MDIAMFDYPLPAERIAQVPLTDREMSKMLVLEGDRIEDRRFVELPSLLRSGDLLVLNDSRVFRARLRDGTTEVLFLRQLEDGAHWEALCRPARRFEPGRCVEVKGVALRVEHPRGKFGKRIMCPPDGVDLMAVLEQLGEPPLPPYIHRNSSPELRGIDIERYQTVYADPAGSAAAPTAGLHFSRRMLAEIETKCEVVRITLHVSNATFQPIRTQSIEDHRMDAEAYMIGDEAARRIEEARERSRRGEGRVVAVGTTVVRALESAAATGKILPGRGTASLYLTPGYRFTVVDALLTNFHQPRSSLLVLVSAFAGIGQVQGAYRHALDHGYRFLSYGDCMFIRHAHDRHTPGLS
ncbi:MAG: tRNA preQ1(34) S-adenosylmethionine ribosyltransferase-isomerase QueA [Acidobacteria bacterium]|nr:tRNA preQ1(34) S-adenosylmethionine ribosyltransferase-isomerase QueA [Acidobacteriota bacterium]